MASMFIFPETQKEFLACEAKKVLQEVGKKAYESLVPLLTEHNINTMEEFLNVFKDQGYIQGFNTRYDDNLKDILKEYGIKYFTNRIHDQGDHNYSVTRTVLY